jgi:hypothetical protein
MIDALAVAYESHSVGMKLGSGKPQFYPIRRSQLFIQK